MLRRALALLFASWLTILIAEPAAMHVCEMHGGASAPAAAEHGHHGSHASMPADEGEHACTCLGDCCGVVPTPVPTADVATFAPASIRREIAFPPVRITERVVAGLRLPFATAPPVLPTIELISLG